MACRTTVIGYLLLIHRGLTLRVQTLFMLLAPLCHFDRFYFCHIEYRITVSHGTVLDNVFCFGVCSMYVSLTLLYIRTASYVYTPTYITRLSTVYDFVVDLDVIVDLDKIREETVPMPDMVVI